MKANYCIWIENIPHCVIADSSGEMSDEEPFFITYFSVDLENRFSWNLNNNKNLYNIYFFNILNNKTSTKVNVEQQGMMFPN